MKSSYQAGSTLPKRASDDQICCWSECAASEFQLRVGPDYKLHKKKDSSPPALCDVVGIDFYKSEKRIDDFGSRINLPEYWTTYDSELKQLGIPVPPLLIFNFQFPADVTTGWLSLFSGVINGPTYSVIIYCRMTQHMEDSILAREKIPMDGAMELLFEYLQSFEPSISPNDDINPYNSNEERKKELHEKFYGRLKLILNCKNIAEFGLPYFISSYNAKPVLLRELVTMVHGNGYNEVDINLHKFNVIGKQAMQQIYPLMHGMIVDFGICLESRDDIEMNETITGCLTMHNINMSYAVPFIEATTNGEEETTEPGTPPSRRFSDSAVPIFLNPHHSASPSEEENQQKSTKYVPCRRFSTSDINGSS